MGVGRRTVARYSGTKAATVQGSVYSLRFAAPRERAFVKMDLRFREVSDTVPGTPAQILGLTVGVRLKGSQPDFFVALGADNNTSAGLFVAFAGLVNQDLYPNARPAHVVSTIAKTANTAAVMEAGNAGAGTCNIEEFQISFQRSAAAGQTTATIQVDIDVHSDDIDIVPALEFAAQPVTIS